MSGAPKVYGWCPGALRPMMSGDGLIVRLRAPLGRLSQRQAHGIADLSLSCGNGRMDLSSRGNLQLRGITEGSHAKLLCGLEKLDLLDTDVTQEARRNILCTPLWQQGDLTHQVADQLADALSKASDLALPSKFGFAVDCGLTPVLQDISADIRFEYHTDTEVLLVADGAPTGRPTPVADAAEAAVELALWFLSHGGAPEGRGRMHRLIARRGPPHAHGTRRRKSALKPRPGTTASGCFVGLEFGQISAETLHQLADRSALRLTPWHMLLLEEVNQIAPLPGLILEATDPRLQVFACTGAPGCLQALSSTRALARDLAEYIPPGQILHISGCEKGCAYPKTASLVLRATKTDCFDLIHNGTAADESKMSPLDAATLRASPDLLQKSP
ncbi:precorrin-3B synthase [Epibacterium ulvae]|uniref:precorrin-3B synthase n=1 Tax=Epibacterium ulvae TaxID=1156985 RepID=UPI002490CAE3|nr:precorrin-3B synthase [Epibacterium ulvae]